MATLVRSPLQTRFFPRVDTRNQIYVRNDALLAPSNPFSQDDWPNPYRARYSFRAESYGKNLSLHFPESILPFNQEDWPGPIRAKWPQAWVPQSNIALLSFVNVPFNQEDWPIPRRVQWPQAWVPQSNIALLSFVDVPFNQEDWPIPRRVQWPQSQSYPSNINLYFPETVLPFNQYDWPQPIRSKYPVAGPTGSLSFTIATPVSYTHLTLPTSDLV